MSFLASVTWNGSWLGGRAYDGSSGCLRSCLELSYLNGWHIVAPAPGPHPQGLQLELAVGDNGAAAQRPECPPCAVLGIA